MSETRIVLIALSDEQCKFGNLDLKQLMTRALRVEQRMKNKVLIEDEQRRYNTYCDRVEFFGHQLLFDGKVESCDLGNDYLDLISKVKEKYPEEARNTRLTANFCPRELIPSYFRQFEGITKQAGVWDRDDVQKKLAFYRKAEVDSCNVVELLQAWIPSLDETMSAVDSEELKKSFLALEVSDSITEDRGGGHFVALKNQIDKVVDLTNRRVPAAVNFSALRHDVITEILHGFVYKRGRPMYVAVTYADGSAASPFPLFCLRERSGESLRVLKQLPVLRVGMMSARHSNDGLDVTVETYWFRNQEISIGRTQAETDDIAYKKSKEMFLRMRPEGSYRINFYQTGFQPAVVGFYRALTEELIFREKLPASLEVTPYYFMGGEYKVGKPWN